MNVHAVEKKTIVIKTEFVKYKTVFDLFKILYSICKMLNTQKHFDYCYCNEGKTQCWLCKFGEYVKNNDVKNDLLRYRQQEDRLLDIADNFWFYIRKIRKDMREKDDMHVLTFFDLIVQNDIIENDIIKFDEEYMK